LDITEGKARRENATVARARESNGMSRTIILTIAVTETTLPLLESFKA
jgi:hypothetical protein